MPHNFKYNAWQEQIFFNLPLVVAEDIKRSEQENRFLLPSQQH
mgnify:CR=1 FL=1